MSFRIVDDPVPSTGRKVRLSVQILNAECPMELDRDVPDNIEHWALVFNDFLEWVHDDDPDAPRVYQTPIGPFQVWGFSRDFLVTYSLQLYGIQRAKLYVIDGGKKDADM